MQMSIESIKKKCGFGWFDFNKDSKVSELESFQTNILEKLDSGTKESIISLLEEFARKANEYRLTKKTTTSFLKFKDNIGNILSEDKINQIENVEQIVYKKNGS